MIEFRWVDLDCDGITVKLRVQDNDNSLTHGQYCDESTGFSMTSSSGKGLKVDVTRMQW